MAANIARQEQLSNEPGDSVVATVVPIRAGSTLAESPRLYYKLKPEATFDPYRTYPNIGSALAGSCRTAAGEVVPDRYYFDLPDSGFFFPGDVIHYYLKAVDTYGGITLQPGDTTGFSSFPGDSNYVALQYPSGYVVHGLPSLRTSKLVEQPRILFWNDFGDRGGEDEWYTALANLGYREGIDYDIYCTQSPSSGVGNGLGGRATTVQLAGYETILYTCGDLDRFTLGNGDAENDPGFDLTVLDEWLRLGNKNLLLSGDGLVSDLMESGSAGQSFVSTWLRVEWLGRDVSPLIGDQSAPVVKAILANPVIQQSDQWLADGGCPGLNRFDAVSATVPAVRLAEFTNPDCVAGSYSLSAATLNSNPLGMNNEIVSFPYDLMFVVNGGCATTKSPVASATRTALLEDILAYFGHSGGGPPTSLPDNDKLTIKCYPNPFNPSVTVAYHLPSRIRLTVQIYNLRGERIRTLLDEVVAAGPGRLQWDGNDADGRADSSGVYLYKTVAAGNTRIGKIALVR